MSEGTSNTPSYTIRVSARAKRARIEVSARSGLVVVVPRGFPRNRIPAFVKNNQAWIERTMQRVSQQLRHPEPGLSCGLPEGISLRAVGQEWKVESRPAESSRLTAMERGNGNLLLSGNVGDTHACANVLCRWVNRKAHEHLVPWLRHVSAQEKLPFGRVLVRSQRTRWGSCSARKTISINQNLLFLPSHLVRYVFVHELCHTVHLNHSREFWALVREREPECAALRLELRKARQWVPPWTADSAY